MPEITEYSPGSFCWVDHGTTDLEKAKAFYAALFGWDYAAVDESGYTMCLRGGMPVAGLYTYDRSMLDMGAPPCWTSYVAVADADATMASAVAAGAQPMGPVIDVPGHGRGGAFSDPTGRPLRHLAGHAATRGPAGSTSPAPWSGTNCRPGTRERRGPSTRRCSAGPRRRCPCPTRPTTSSRTASTSAAG